MSRVRFVKPEKVRIPLSDGDWIEVKRFLTAGEELGIARDSFRAVRANRHDPAQPTVEVDMQAWRLAKLETYLTAWSFIGLDNESTAPTPETIAALDMDTIREIETALDGFLKTTEAAPGPQKGSTGATSS